ncbi:hypothetical protein F8388_017391 [Cannabis sativa]|uniref:MYB-CC type transcription factor LHEQLE-containing domain-containing protein n=1 Tax=Cannabis sativa TaxID=3483 RepID=A0A7J6H939_CANSA|nr:hypothetical protein F8388_017391 [Cannabis sativa]
MERSFGYENGIVMTRDPKPRLRWTADLHDRFVDAVTKLGGPESVVQKKLQMRIEAQGKYLQAILEKAQKSLSLDMNGPGNIEVAKAQLTDFNLALSNFMENMTEVEEKASIIDQMGGVYRKQNDSSFKIYQESNREDSEDSKLKDTNTIHFDLNTKGGYDFVGANSLEFEPKMLSYGR